MLLGVADAAGGKGIHARIMPPERWQRMSTAKKQKSIRISTLNKVSGMMHMPQNTLREQYLDTVSLLIEHDPAGFARDLSFDADQLNFFLSDRARSAAIIKALAQEEKEKEKEQQKELEKKAREEKKKPAPAPELPKEKPAVPEIPAEPAEKKPPSADSVHPVRRVLTAVIPVEDHAAVNLLPAVTPGFESQVVDDQVGVDPARQALPGVGSSRWQDGSRR